MGDTSVGPGSKHDQRKAPDAVDPVAAQEANESDTRHGLAGAETNPFSQNDPDPAHRHRPGDSETAPDEPNDMVSGRRNAGRDDASEAPP